MNTLSNIPEVREAQKALRRTVQAEEAMVEAVIDGDTSIDAMALVAAQAQVRLAHLHVQAAQRRVDQQAQAVRDRRQREAAERRQKDAEAARARQREGWREAIRSGEAAGRIDDIRAGEGSMSFPPEYAQMLVDAGLVTAAEVRLASQQEVST